MDKDKPSPSEDATLDTSPAETIVAIATATGAGAIGIVRMSGPGALTICDRVFRHNRGISTAQRPSHKLCRGWAISPAGDRIDDVLCVLMRGPSSYTGEDTVELQGHGGRAVLDAMLDACLTAGARLARPGEFTERAFLNGRLDLAQAEAVAAIIAATTEQQRRVALNQLDGALSQRLHQAQQRLVATTAELEAYIDFPEEDLPTTNATRMLADMQAVADDLGRLQETYDRGRIAVHGARIVLVGAPNAGKSSLLNALVGRERAIISPHPGTTRDTIEATVDIAGFSVTLVDTAGLRETSDDIERQGVERSQQALADADFVVVVVDGTNLTDPNFVSLMDTLPEQIGQKPAVVVMNKADLMDRPADAADALGRLLRLPAIPISAATSGGLELLEARFHEFLKSHDFEGHVALTTRRQLDLVTECVQNLRSAIARLNERESIEFIAHDLHEALHHIAAFRGVDIGDAVMDEVFRKFCLGK